MFEVKKTAVSVKNHVHRFRGRYAAIATASVCFAVSRAAVKEWNQFLTDNDLVDKFYAPEDE